MHDPRSQLRCLNVGELDMNSSNDDFIFVVFFLLITPILTGNSSAASVKRDVLQSVDEVYAFPSLRNTCTNVTSKCPDAAQSAEISLRLSCSFEVINDSNTGPARLFLPVCGPTAPQPSGDIDVWKTILWYPYQFRYTDEERNEGATRVAQFNLITAK